MHVRPEYLIRLMFAMTVATICGATYSVTAHAQALVWATSIGGPGFDSSSDVAVDDVGNSYVIGVYTGSALVGAGDPNEIALTSAGSVDIFVASYDANGAVRWAWSAADRRLIRARP